MRTIIRLIKTELRVMFFSPIAWLMLIVFAIQAAIVFISKYNNALDMELSGMINERSHTLALFFGHTGAVTNLISNIYLYMPLITMGLISRELSSGSIKLLNSSPMSNFQIVISKFLSVVTYQLGFIIILFICLTPAFFMINNIDVPVIFTGLLGVFLTLCAYAAIGLFMSCITHYQIIAAVSTLITLAFLNSVGQIGQEYNFVRDITYWLSLSGRTDEFLSGVLSSKDVIYFILVVCLFLAASVNRLNGMFQCNNKKKLYLKYGGILCSVLLFGYFTSRPLVVKVYDSTATKSNTLTKESQEALLNAGKNITLTTYVNALSENAYLGMPNFVIQNDKKFEKYIRQNPYIKMRYVYYYKRTSSSFAFYTRSNPNMSEKELFELVCKNNDYDKDLFIPYEDLKDKESIDLSDEDFKFVRCFQTDDGKRAFLRVFDDMMIEPTEVEISTAIKTLYARSPKVGFVKGHNERDIYSYKNRDYRPLYDKGYRYSLTNKGFDICDIDLSQEVGDDIDVLIVADSRTHMSDDELSNFDNFLNRGGNMILLGDVGSQLYMNPLLDRLGLKFGNDQLVQPGQDKHDNVIFADMTKDGEQINRDFFYLNYTKTSASMPSAVSIEEVEFKGFDVKNLLTTKENGTWNEKQTTNFIDEKAELNSEDGEIEKSYSLMKYLTRNVNGKEQRIFVLGDADCISTEELNPNRRGSMSMVMSINGVVQQPKRLNNEALLSGLFRCISYDQYPIMMTGERAKDNTTNLTTKTISVLKIILIWIIPILIIAGYFSIWFVRRRY